ncbi:MAG TPA: methyltransferase [Phenylobacterium sp.]|jgi:predicted methyltransferase|uniref:class I SAM-dependent methyltransferase n=1 Tax=Phenylobacterium sp. TaxID=1871053 RepID=UPI002C876124|nr:methyltransferase [Phenylobacterium sp.]HXA40846.1 methyltransferase [Phenylobacterium sp.]
MARNLMVSVLAAVAVAGAGLAAAAVPANLTAALGDQKRPPADSSRDVARKPAELLALGEVKPGQKVADFMMGGGYFTRILSPAVGPTGKVYAYQSSEFIKFRAAYGSEQSSVVADYKNVVPLTAPVAAAGLPEGLDLVLTVQNYHDLHLKAFPAETADTVNREIFKALKPGGIYLVVDHAAAPGSPLTVADTQHRIDEAIVKTEVEAAGFKLVTADDKLLGNPEDPHDKGVFDPSIRGHTDQFVLKFRKPK